MPNVDEPKALAMTRESAVLYLRQYDQAHALVLSRGTYPPESWPEFDGIYFKQRERILRLLMGAAL